MRRVAASVVLTVLVSTALAGCGDDDGDAAAGAEVTEVTRTELAEAAPEGAPGQVLYLQEVTIPPGEQLAEHFHQGTQLATVRSGTLTYNLVRGTVDITRAGGEQEEATGPSTVELEAGDSIVERETVVHFGANDGDEPVVITLAALLESGAPMATPTG
jgi:quercetin dioxygenase-like cupin family protein